MPLTNLEVSQAINRILATIDPQTQTKLVEGLNLMLVTCLSPTELRAYQLFSDGDWFITHDVADELSISIFHAGNILLKLFNLGLLERQPVTGKNGLHYEWKKVNFTP
jgi:predicted transcriptional regulator